jgi:hypothetical protein
MWNYLKFPIKIDLVPHYFYSHQFINNTTCRNVCYKKESERQWTNSRVGYITFYNKNWLHYKVKVIFFFTSLINMYWLNVSIRLFFSYKNKTSPGSGEGEASSMFRWGRGGVVLCHILIEIASQWTIVGKVFGCVMRSGG